MVSTLCLKQCDPPSTPLKKILAMPLSPIFLVFPSCIFFCPVSCKALCHHGFFWPCLCINYSPTAPFFFYNNNFLIKTFQASYGSSDNNSIIDWQKCMPIFQKFKTKKIVSIITVRYCLQKSYKV